MSKRNNRSSSSSESPDSAEEERLRDLKERDEFSDRLKKKDEGRTRNVIEVSFYFVYFHFHTVHFIKNLLFSLPVNVVMKKRPNG